MAVLKLDNANFEASIKEGVTIVDFWAEWCGPCRMLGPTIEELGNEAVGFKVAKVNIDENPELADLYSIMSIPTIMIFKNGEIADAMMGVTSKAVLQKKVNAVLA